MRIEEIEKLINDSEPLRLGDGPELLSLVVSLYEKQRIEGTEIEEDGDMLLFQWGTYDWGKGNFFEIDLTRQTMLAIDDPDDASESMRQLRTTLLFTPTSETQKIGEGNQWCSSPDSVEQFLEFIKSSVAFTWITKNTAHKICIELGHV